MVAANIRTATSHCVTPAVRAHMKQDVSVFSFIIFFIFFSFFSFFFSAFFLSFVSSLFFFSVFLHSPLSKHLFYILQIIVQHFQIIVHHFLIIIQKIVFGGFLLFLFIFILHSYTHDQYFSNIFSIKRVKWIAQIVHAEGGIFLQILYAIFSLPPHIYATIALPHNFF